MSYYIMNKLEFGGYMGSVDELFDKLLDENGNFSFHNIIPVPDDTDRNKLTPNELAEIFNECTSSWGCGIDAIDPVIDKDAHIITFKTKLGTPDRVIDKIAELEPRVNIHWDYCGEAPRDNGSVCYQNGTFVERTTIREGTIEALENWCVVWNEPLETLDAEEVAEARKLSASLKERGMDITATLNKYGETYTEDDYISAIRAVIEDIKAKDIQNGYNEAENEARYMDFDCMYEIVYDYIDEIYPEMKAQFEDDTKTDGGFLKLMEKTGYYTSGKVEPQETVERD